MPSPNHSEIITTTIQSRSKVLADNVSENNALLHYVKKRGNVKPFSGGNVILQELNYAENGTFTRYSGYENLNISPSDVFTAAEFAIKQAAVAVSISGLEELQNAGPEQMIDLITARVENAEQTMMNNIASDCYSDGTADGSKQIGGLQYLVADDPTTGTVGGINRATWAFWQNVMYDATTDGAATTASNIRAQMTELWVQLVRGTDHPNLILMDNVYFQLYMESLQAIQRITTSDDANSGFTKLKFMNADVVLDGGYGGAAPSSHMYFLNTKYIHFRPHKDRNMVPLGSDRVAVNQDATVKLIVWAGNMTGSNLRLQGVYKE